MAKNPKKIITLEEKVLLHEIKYGIKPCSTAIHNMCYKTNSDYTMKRCPLYDGKDCKDYHPLDLTPNNVAILSIKDRYINDGKRRAYNRRND